MTDPSLYFKRSQGTSRIQRLCSCGAFTDSSVKSKQGTDSLVDIFSLI